MARPPGTWTDAADAELRRHVDSGLSRVKIAAAMGISVHAVMYRMHKLNLHSGVIRSQAQRANIAAVIVDRMAIEAEHVAAGRALQALAYRQLAALVADSTANLRNEQSRVERMQNDARAGVKFNNPVSDVRELQVSLGIAHDKLAAYRKEDRETSMASEGGDRIKVLVEMLTERAPEYDPDAAV